MKTLLLIAMLSGQYCGADVPYDFIILDDVLAIRSSQGIEECRFDGEKADCPTSHDMSIRADAEGRLVASWEGLSEPIVMPKCGAQ